MSDEHTMDEHTTDTSEQVDGRSGATGRSGVGRRTLLGGLAVGGVAVAGGVVGSRTASASGFRSERLAIDVACLGEMWREAMKANPADDGDFRAPFLVEGWIYPEGTIAGDGFIPREEGSIGRWFCHGYVAIDGSRPEPHVVSQQTYVFGTISEERLFPPDTLMSAGLEGTFDKSQRATRAIIGGTGEYLAATGQVVQEYISDNVSPFADGTDGPSPNFRFAFDLRIPE